MRTFDKDSWRVWLASFYGKELSGQVNICALNRRAMEGLLCLVVGIPILCTLVCLGSVFGFFIAHRVGYKKDDPCDELMVEYDHWPEIAGRRVWPVTIIATLATLYGLWYGVVSLIQNWDVVASYVWNTSTSFCFALVVVTGLAVWGIVLFVRSDAGRVTGEWWRAKKKKICPIIQIETNENKEVS